MSCIPNGNSGLLMALASALSFLLAQGHDSEQIGRMAAFFTLLGDSLALLALQPGERRGESAPCVQQSQAPGQLAK